MAYTCNLILRTLPAIEHELHPEDEITHVDFGDLPRPHYYDRVPPSHPAMDSLNPGSQVSNSTEPYETY